MRFTYRSMISTLTLFTMANFTHAETIKDAVGPGDIDNKWVISANVGVYGNVYGGEGSSGSLYPSFEYNGDRFFVKNGSINYSIGQHGNFSHGLIAQPTFSFLGDESEYRSNTKLAGLQERDGTIEGGFYIHHTTELGRFRLALLNDLAGKHDGQRVTASYTYDLQAGNWSINPSFGVQWISSDIVNHHFGVSQNEATATRAAYDGNSAFNFFAGVRARIDLSERWDFGASTGFTVLDSSITDSSIVEEDYGYHADVSLSYKF